MTEVQEVSDDAISDECIEASNERGEELLEALVNDFDPMEAEGLDPTAVVYHLWVSFTYLLVQFGWTPAQLAEEASIHGYRAVIEDVAGHA